MKVLIVDDHPLVRKSLYDILSLDKSIEITGVAKNGSEALSSIENDGPDIVLMDLRLGEENGLDVIDKAKKNDSSSKFIVLTSSANPNDFIMADELNIDGYVLKEAPPDELIYAINLVGGGRKYYDPGLVEYKIRQ